ncbi:MAG: tetratricopeptide repeat protein [Planctomycetes bacterium]|nr:tetratricopeptide repeat protein [Planctomycetota bacterium]
MSAARYQRAAEIFFGACELPKEAREAHIARECGDDVELRRLVEEMLRGDDQSLQLTGSNSVRAGLEQLLDTADSPAEGGHASALPERIGPYKVVRHIGRGGMGDVYEGRQENPDRSVAIKLMRSGVESPAMFRRFRREVEFLGRLAHPGIAQIFDAGVADIAGARVPFFAMEYVRGVSLTEFAQSHHLTIAQRLDLVASVCDIVQFAHQQGVIHRDLKPGNILVVEVAADTASPGQTPAPTSTVGSSFLSRSGLPLPRILDFGIARMSDESQHSGTFATEAGQMVGTLGFMSPEQVRNEPGKVDTRSDIYALGVILYLLLSGRMPHAIEGKNAFDAAREVLERDPARLGTLAPDCRGDIETIVATAMHKDKDRRYASAAQLAADLRRYIANEPISARPATASYLFRKFAARHKGLVAAAATITVLIISSAITIGVLYQREQRQRALAQAAQAAAEREAANQKEMVSFLVADTFGAASASKKGPTLRVVEVLDDAAAAVDERFKADPALRGRVRSTVANLFFSTGQYEKALAAISRAIEELDAAGEADIPLTIEAVILHGSVQDSLGHSDRAEQLFRDSLARCDRGRDDVTDARTHATALLAETLQKQGKHAEAEPLLRHLIATGAPATPSQWEIAISVRLSLAASLGAQRRADEVGALLKETVDLARTNIGEAHPVVLAAMNNYASYLMNSGRGGEAAPIALAVLAGAEKAYPSGHPTIGFAALTSARALVLAGRTQEAKDLAVRGLEIFRSRFDDADFNVERASEGVVQVFKLARDPVGAEPYFKMYLRARLFAAAAHEGEGVVARTAELRQMLAAQPGKTPPQIEHDLNSFIDDCRTNTPLIVKEGGPQSSPHAARYLANLARGIWAQRDAAPAAAARCPQLLDEARACLAASNRAEEDRRLIDAVAAEIQKPGTP